MPSDLRTQILIDVQQNGVGALSAIEQAIAQVKAAMLALTQSFAAGETGANEWRRGLAPLTSDLKFLEGQLKAIDPEWARMQAALQAMGERSAEAALSVGGLAEAQARATATLTELVQVEEHQRRVLADIDPEWTALQAKLREMGERDAKAATDGILANNEGLRQGQSAVNGFVQALERNRAATLEVADTLNNLNRVQVISTKEVQDDQRAIEQRIKAHYTEVAALRDVTNAEENFVKYLEAANVAEAEAFRARRMLGPEESAALNRKLQLNQVTDDAAEKSKRFGYGVLYASQAIEDLQYGLGAVLNNIPLMVMGFGGGPGLAGTISLVSVGLKVAIDHMGDFLNFRPRMQGFTSDVEMFKEKVDGLKGSWFAMLEPMEKAVALQRDFNAAKEAEKEKTKPGEQVEANKGAYERSLKETPGGGRAVENLIRELMTGEVLSDEAGSIERAVAEGQMDLSRFGIGKRSSKQDIWKAMQDPKTRSVFMQNYMERVMPTRINERINELAGGEEGAVDRLINEAGAHPRLGARRNDIGDFQDPFLFNLQHANRTPASELRNIDEEDRQLDQKVEESVRKMKEAHKKGQNKLVDQLNAQGKEIEHDTLRGMAQDLGIPRAPADQEDLTRILNDKKAKEAAQVQRNAMGEFQKNLNEKVRADARAEKNAPRAAAEQTLQDEFGLSPEAAHMQAPGFMRDTAAGMPEQTAGRAAVARLQEMVQAQQRMILEQEAAFEQMNGFFGQASMDLARLNAGVGAMRQNMSNFSSRMQGSRMPQGYGPF